MGTHAQSEEKHETRVSELKSGVRTRSWKEYGHSFDWAENSCSPFSIDFVYLPGRSRRTPSCDAMLRTCQPRLVCGTGTASTRAVWKRSNLLCVRKGGSKRCRHTDTHTPACASTCGAGLHGLDLTAVLEAMRCNELWPGFKFLSTRNMRGMPICHCDRDERLRALRGRRSPALRPPSCRAAFHHLNEGQKAFIIHNSIKFCQLYHCRVAVAQHICGQSLPGRFVPSILAGGVPARDAPDGA